MDLFTRQCVNRKMRISQIFLINITKRVQKKKKKHFTSNICQKSQI